MPKDAICCHVLFSFPRISGNAASDKNIKDGVCAQIEKNFARAKWKVIFCLHKSRVSMYEVVRTYWVTHLGPIILF